MDVSFWTAAQPTMPSALFESSWAYLKIYLAVEGRLICTGNLACKLIMRGVQAAQRAKSSQVRHHGARVGRCRDGGLSLPLLDRLTIFFFFFITPEPRVK